MAATLARRAPRTDRLSTFFSQRLHVRENRRADLCPAYGAERTFLVRARDQIRQFNKMVDVASRAAVAFFTGGLSGGIGP